MFRQGWSFRSHKLLRKCTTALQANHRCNSFDAYDATVRTVHQALFSGEASCRDVVEAFLARIEAHNSKINAIISLNSHALQEADTLDERMADGKTDGALFGVPILLKDNFDAVGMPTTAASLALRDLWPTSDAAVVKSLRKAGAIVLGKTNLHEFALEGLTVSSLGGQTMNPFDLTRTPGGSSGGSGAAVAASFAVMATGSDTVNSLRSPASANSLYSLRPTQGLLSRSGIVPVGSTQDTVGMIGRSLHDIAIALTVMVKAAPVNDGTQQYISRTPKSIRETDFAWPLLNEASKPLASFRIGILHSFLDTQKSPETDPVNTAIHNVQSLLIAEKTTMIDINDTSVFNPISMLSSMDVQMFEIRGLIDSYLSSPNLRGTFPRNFAEIFTSRPDPNVLILPSQSSYVRTALTSSTNSPEYVLRKQRISKLTQIVHETFRAGNLDAIIYPQQRNLVVPIGSRSQHGRNGILAAVTGLPSICIPIGFSSPTGTAPLGLPIGMEIMGTPWSEVKLFEIARAIDEKLLARKAPITARLNERIEAKQRYNSVPKIVPGGSMTIDLDAYPLGKF